jgi:hypothetical protein
MTCSSLDKMYSCKGIAAKSSLSKGLLCPTDDSDLQDFSNPEYGPTRLGDKETVSTTGPNKNKVGFIGTYIGADKGLFAPI